MDLSVNIGSPFARIEMASINVFGILLFKCTVAEGIIPVFSVCAFSELKE
jgi:hypothetical protein